MRNRGRGMGKNDGGLLTRAARVRRGRRCRRQAGRRDIGRVLRTARLARPARRSSTCTANSTRRTDTMMSLAVLSLRSTVLDKLICVGVSCLCSDSSSCCCSCSGCGRGKDLVLSHAIVVRLLCNENVSTDQHYAIVDVAGRQQGCFI